MTGATLRRRDDGAIELRVDGVFVMDDLETTSERLLRKMNEDKGMKMNVISAKDHGESFLTLETGRAVAFMMDDAVRSDGVEYNPHTLIDADRELRDYFAWLGRVTTGDGRSHHAGDAVV